MAQRQCSHHHYVRHTNSWGVSLVTDMSYLLGQYSDSSNTASSCGTTFNSDIGNWGVSGVTTMESMLAYCSSFKQDIGQWNVGSVMSMANLFYYDAAAFDRYAEYIDRDPGSSIYVRIAHHKSELWTTFEPHLVSRASLVLLEDSRTVVK